MYLRRLRKLRGDHDLLQTQRVFLVVGRQTKIWTPVYGTCVRRGKPTESASCRTKLTGNRNAVVDDGNSCGPDTAVQLSSKRPAQRYPEGHRWANYKMGIKSAAALPLAGKRGGV